MKRLTLSILFLLISTIIATAASRFAVCATTCTWDNSSTAMWSTTSGGAPGASAPGATDTAIFDNATCVGGTTCTITPNANLDISSIILGTCTASTTGCILDFSVNNNNVVTEHVGSENVQITGTGVRTFRMGNGTWTMNGAPSGTVFDAGITTNLTFSANSSNIVVNAINTGSTVSFHGGGLTYHNVTINANPNAGPGRFVFTGVNTFNSLVINGKNIIQFPLGTTTTITTLAINGTNTGLANINSGTTGSAATLSVAANPVVGTWVNLDSIACTGGATFTFTNSFPNTSGGCTISNPSAGTTSACILGGWLLWRDMPGNLNDNFPAWLEKAG